MSTPEQEHTTHPQGKTEIPGILYGLSILSAGIFAVTAFFVFGATGAEMDTQERFTTNSIGYGVAAGQNGALAPAILVMALCVIVALVSGIAGHKVSVRLKSVQEEGRD